jgi:hypothetical protein
MSSATATLEEVANHFQVWRDNKKTSKWLWIFKCVNSKIGT